MSNKNRWLPSLVLLIAVLLPLVLTSCGVDWEHYLTREAGKQMREELDTFMKALGEFLAGFCGMPANATAILILAVVIPRLRHHR
jgi:hypothetical protein